MATRRNKTLRWMLALLIALTPVRFIMAAPDMDHGQSSATVSQSEHAAHQTAHCEPDIGCAHCLFATACAQCVLSLITDIPAGSPPSLIDLSTDAIGIPPTPSPRSIYHPPKFS